MTWLHFTNYCWLYYLRIICHIALLLSVYYNTSILLTNILKKQVLDNYKLLISLYDKNKKRANITNFKDFITAKPVTLHRDNIRKVKGVPNILTNYGVTYKADGINMLF